jgi:hypothetical protein
MKKATQFVVCVLALLLAMAPALSASLCGERMHCGPRECMGCCGQMTGMPASSNDAMHCAEDRMGARVEAQITAPSFEIEGANCRQAIRELPQFTAAPGLSGPVALALQCVRLTPDPKADANAEPDGTLDASAPARYLRFRVFRI